MNGLRGLLPPLLTGLLLLCSASLLPATELLDKAENWVVEQAEGGKTHFQDGQLEITDAKGCSVWLKQKLHTPLRIRYQASFITEGGPCDRLSDLNCFWLASDPRHPEDLFHKDLRRTGLFKEYDALRLYYVGYGGNNNTTTRFRRYLGDGTKPLSSDHDLQTPPFLLQANHLYSIEIIADGSTVEYRRDGEIIFKWTDPAPLREGWFAFRTVNSHTRISHFTVEEGKAALRKP